MPESDMRDGANTVEQARAIGSDVEQKMGRMDTRSVVIFIVTGLVSF